MNVSLNSSSGSYYLADYFQPPRKRYIIERHGVRATLLVAKGKPTLYFAMPEAVKARMIVYRNSPPDDTIKLETFTIG